MRRLALTALLTLATVLTATGCKPSGDGNTRIPPPRPKVYYCPDHPQSVGVKGDRCKVCGVALIERPTTTQPGDD